MYHTRKFMSDYHLSFGEIENMSIDFLLDLELLDSKVEAAFEEKQRAKSGLNKLYNGGHVFIDQIL